MASKECWLQLGSSWMASGSCARPVPPGRTRSVAVPGRCGFDSAVCKSLHARHAVGVISSVQYSVHSRCTVSAQSVHSLCSFGVQSVHSQCTVGAQSVHSRCTVSAQSVHSQCTVGAQSVHTQQTVGLQMSARGRRSARLYGQTCAHNYIGHNCVRSDMRP